MKPEAKTSEYYMGLALEEARRAEERDEVPIGCIIVKDGKVISSTCNARQESQISTHHAEILAIEEACRKLGSWRLEDCDLYVTLEPCPMCAGAILQSRIRSVYYGASDHKGGCVDTLMKMYETPGFNHYPKWEGGIRQEECAAILSDFFRKKREQKKREKLLQTQNEPAESPAPEKL